MTRVVIAVVFLAGCAAMEPTPRPPEVERIEVVSQVEAGQLFDRVRLALIRDGFGIEFADRDAGMIRTEPVSHAPRYIKATVTIVPTDSGSVVFVGGRGRYSSSATPILNSDDDYVMSSHALHWDVVERAAVAVRAASQVSN